MSAEDPMEPWGCPWCGEGCDVLNALPDDRRSIMAYDMWLEEHVTACEPYLKEIGEEEPR